ncbi:acetyl-CoA carboxylase biotin carboxyl carrier protein [bacterium]|nr:acetyl-CoA carboxylase biotin carboxyl carrier protein [bacterium]
MAAPRVKAEKVRFDLHEIKKLVEMLERSPISEFEFVEKDLRIRISKNGASSAAAQVVHAPLMSPAAVAPAPVLSPVPAAAPAPSVAPPPPPALALVEVKSPMVGTFYRAPSPDTEAYVRVGDLVEPGRVLCIVEAMKLMNELECEVRGRIVEILVENVQPVEFGQVLFRIDTSSV